MTESLIRDEQWEDIKNLQGYLIKRAEKGARLVVFRLLGSKQDFEEHQNAANYFPVLVAEIERFRKIESEREKCMNIFRNLRTPTLEEVKYASAKAWEELEKSQ